MKLVIMAFVLLPFCVKSQVPRATTVVNMIHDENEKKVEAIKRRYVQDNYAAALSNSKDYLETALSTVLQDLRINKDIFHLTACTYLRHIISWKGINLLLTVSYG